MKILVDNSNDEVVFIAPEIEYSGNNTITKNDTGDIVLIFGDMTPENSRIEAVEEPPADFSGRNYYYSGGRFIKK
jgi:hypothetical protein